MLITLAKVRLMRMVPTLLGSDLSIYGFCCRFPWISQSCTKFIHQRIIAHGCLRAKKTVKLQLTKVRRHWPLFIDECLIKHLKSTNTYYAMIYIVILIYGGGFNRIFHTRTLTKFPFYHRYSLNH